MTDVWETYAMWLWTFTQLLLCLENHAGFNFNYTQICHLHTVFEGNILATVIIQATKVMRNTCARLASRANQTG